MGYFDTLKLLACLVEQFGGSINLTGSDLTQGQLLWGDIGLARNMCKIQPPKPGPTQTPCAPPVRELWVACSATQELPTRLSYAPRTLEQKSKCWGKKVCAGHASHTLAHCFQEMSTCIIADR